MHQLYKQKTPLGVLWRFSDDPEFCIKFYVKDGCPDEMNICWITKYIKTKHPNKSWAYIRELYEKELA